MQRLQEKRLTDQPILSTLFRLSWPIMLSQAGQLLYNLIDTIWVGRLGAEYLAAITLAFPVIFIVFSLGLGFSIAGVSLVSQHTGANQEEEANHAAGQVLSFTFLVAVLFSVLGLVFGQKLLTLIGAEPDVLPHAWDYLRIITAGFPLMFLFFIFDSVLQSVGDTITPMKIKFASVAVNIVLDPLLIFGWWVFPRMAIAGAAVATIISRLGATGIGLYLLFSGRKDIQLRLQHLVPNLKIIKQIIRIGLPAALGDSALSIALTVMTSIVAGFGTFVLAAWGVGNRITSMIRMPSMGLGRATGVMVGQHLGADQPGRAEETARLASRLIFGIMLSLALLLFLFVPYFLILFTDEREVLEIGTTYLRIAGFAYAFLGVQQVLVGALQGAGKTVEQTFFNILNLWLLQIPLALLFAYPLGLGADGLWWGIFAAKFLGASAITLWFRRGTWKSKVI